MSTHSSPTPDTHPPKRPRRSSPERASPNTAAPAAPTSPATDQSPTDAATGVKIGQSSNFRNVSACNRCRLRKNRCDQKLPSCASCEKARVPCVGYDPITKREIPRSYVYYLETRVEQLEALLRANIIQFPPSEDLDHCSRTGADGGAGVSPTDGNQPGPHDSPDRRAPLRQDGNANDNGRQNHNTNRGIAPSKRQLGSANGVSFARVVFAAVQSSMGDQRSSSDKTGGARPYKPIAGNGAVASGTSMRDSFFGLHTKPTISQAEFPNKELALKLVNLYFEHANPQIPVLHRVNFMEMFELAYASEGRIRGPRELYILNMVFAIGGGIIMDGQAFKPTEGNGEAKGSRQAQPEEYHASAIVHLEACLSISGGGLEELQAVLLLANFALLRPVPPGLWYIVGVAVRLAVDLGLHYEDGKDVEVGLPNGNPGPPAEAENPREAYWKEKGRREYVRDMRRRLWWCTYSFDRLVSACVGRPFGVSDQVVTTEFPSLLDDKYITLSGLNPPSGTESSYKIVAYHYFRLRLLQSEILQVLQYQQALIARKTGQNSGNKYMHTHLPSPFLDRFDSFRSWRRDIDRRLLEWKNSSPTREDSGVAFSTEFLDLNYWQAIIMLYRQSLSIPAMFEGEYNTSKEMDSPSIYPAEQGEDVERVYLKVAEAGQKIIRLYRQLHVMGLVNYTYLATHHLFMAGISYLYAIWHSRIVRSRLSNDEVDFTILAATSVFSDLIEKCPPAEACRDAFDRTSKATIKMASSKGGFGRIVNRSKHSSKGSHDRDYISARDATANRQKQHQYRASMEQANFRPTPQSQFDMTSTPSTDGFAMNNFSNQLRPMQPNQQFSLSMPSIKPDPDGFSMLRGLATTNLSNSASPDTNTGPDNSSIDPVLLPSPAGQQVQSPISVASLATPVSAPGTSMANILNHTTSPTSSAFTPGGQQLNYADLQGMGFLQGLANMGGPGAFDGDMSGEQQMDLGFGLGWEGTHHDFSDGQQLDLFDGFFFGGQTGGGGGG
ncbi:c6 zinc finger domain containing protein [Apiospora phragmitis]|uniref:C6 zinc finger domain containing protein n=1 Tax=Apiospora phragmitis TaxID=2905665 RepID=A0ABR1X5U7_9PEZI